MSFIQKNIYPYMPVPIQNLMISAYGFQWNRRRFGGVFKSELQKFKEREYFTFDRWNEYQNNELRKLLSHAYETVPFYREKYSNAGFKLADLTNLKVEEINLLPVLEKNELREFGTSKLLSNTRDKGGVFLSSSGSTGTPTKIFFSKEMHQRWSAAFEVRIRNWAGLSIKDSRGMIGGRRIIQDSLSSGPFFRYNYIEKQIYFSAYHISNDSVENYACALWKYEPKYMTGYAMSNYFLARFFQEKEILVPPLKAVITSSEKLTQEMRDIFGKVYGCKTYDSYSGVEACGLISETEYGQLLISPDVGVMEILKEDGTPCMPGETGEICSTGLLNFDQPLIRYKIGDLVKLSDNQKTKCGRNMVVVDEIVGRVEDTVIGKDGREMVRFHGVFIDLPSVIEGQIIQNTLDDFEIKVVCSINLTDKERELIRSRMFSQLGNINLIISQVDSIPRNQNGKFKSVVSKVKRN